MRRRGSLYLTLVSCYLFVVLAVFMQVGAKDLPKIPSPVTPYFSYTVPSEKVAPSSHEMGVEELKKWDEVTSELVYNGFMGQQDQDKLFAFLYVAQRDAAALSYEWSGKFSGSLGPISRLVLLHFFPKVQIPDEGDAYSHLLASVVLSRLSEQFGKNYFCLSPDLLDRIPAPPAANSPEWKEELEEVHKEQKSAGVKEMREIRYWAGLMGRGSGNWHAIVNEYMEAHATPFPKRLLVRSDLAIGLSDTSQGVAALKQRYRVQRPPFLDSTIIPSIEMPSGYSYPSGHAAAGELAASLLSFYFPERAREWREMGYSQGWGRVQAGIHYPVDFEAGVLLGSEVASCILHSEPSHK